MPAVPALPDFQPPEGTLMKKPKAAKPSPKIGQFKLTARTDAPDFRDFIYEPALVSLKQKLAVPKNLNIRHQGNKPSCTGFGLAAVIDRLMIVAGNKTAGKEGVSTLMLYEMALRHDEWTDEADEGSSCRGAIKGWYNMGVCRETLYPYDDTQKPKWNVDAAKDARNNTIGAYYRLGLRISDYHAALNETGAIYCSALVHKGWDKPDDKTGHIKFQKNVQGGHAFAIVGYDQDGFWVQNSWGRDWGKNGTALWTYEDWQLHVQDAWVFQMALATPQIWHLPARTAASKAGAESSPKPTRTEIAGHFVHVDDGKFHTKGTYWSNLEDVQLTANLLANSADYQHLLFYAHGGLNSPDAAACRVAAMKNVFKDNGIYAYHWMYDTGLSEELKDIILGRGRSAREKAGGALDWVDKIIEKITRVPGRALWREMKAGAGLPFADKPAGATEEYAGVQVLRAFFNALAASSKPKQIHLVGHSTGMILLAWLLQRLGREVPGLQIHTVSFLAPAGSVKLFTDLVQPLLKAPHPDFRISELTIYNLNKKLEEDDDVGKVYNKSLLYLVSNAFEEELPENILGMEKFSETVARRNLPRLTIHYSSGKSGNPRITASETHGGFDNDPLTMNHILRRILGKAPKVEFTAESLKY
jgi:hypothetical protein